MILHRDFTHLLLGRQRYHSPMSGSIRPLNGLNYRINDRDYDWEEEFDKILIKMPFGKEFDIANIGFLLLLLYNSTHDTNYVLSEAFTSSS